VQSFNYGSLSPDHQAKLRRFISEIHKFGCLQTPAAVEIGKMLIDAKPGLKGNFEIWCISEAGYPMRKAQLLMNLAKLAGKHSEVLSIPVSAGYRLAAPSTPPDIVQKVLSAARDGKRVTVSWVEELLEKANKKESESERSSTTSEVTKIAKLLANALEPGQARILRKVLEAAGATLTQRFVSQLQSELEDELHDTSAAPLVKKTAL
jgi:hypothetical protein